MREVWCLGNRHVDGDAANGERARVRWCGGEFDADVCRTEMGVVGQPLRWLDGDVVFGLAQSGQGRYFAEHDADGVTNGVGEGGLGAGLATKEVVAELIYGFAARACLASKTRR